MRVERLSPLHAEAAMLGEAVVAGSFTLTADAARPVINQAIAAWQLADPRAASALGNVEVIVSDLPQRVLGLSSEASRTISLGANEAVTSSLSVIVSVVPLAMYVAPAPNRGKEGQPDVRVHEPGAGGDEEA